MNKWMGHWLFLAPLLCAVWASSAGAESALYNTPVYDPVSKRYFALIDARDRVYVDANDRIYKNGNSSMYNYTGRKWRHAAAEAASREFKGIRGHLAIVDSLEVHEFLLKTFHPDIPTWVGLRYMCKGKYLEDISGNRLERTAFQAWAQNWRADPADCDKQLYMAVAYNPVRLGFRWIGFGTAKQQGAYFIEYPVGQRSR